MNSEREKKLQVKEISFIKCCGGGVGLEMHGHADPLRQGGEEH